MTENPLDIFDFVILKHFGFICLILTILFAGIQKLYSLIRIKKHPELKDGYSKIILGFLIFMGLPWLPLALGELVYGISGIVFLFLLGDGNLFSWMFYIFLFCEYGFLIVWVWFYGGGEFLHKYQLMTYNFQSPIIAKVVVTLMVLGGIIGSMFLVLINFALS